MRWQETLRAKLGSDRKAAVRLHREWRKEAPAEAKEIQPVSLATKIGDLGRGKTVWWKKRERPLKLLARMLDVEIETLLGERGPSAGSLAFPEFPNLAVLGPNEEPFRIFREGWLLDVALGDALSGPPQKPKRRWIVAPPGYGKSLVIRYLQARSTGSIVSETVKTLEEGAVHANTRLPLVLELEESSSVDAEVIGKLQTRAAPTIVLAPFRPPAGAVLRMATWEFEQPELPRGFRERFLAWIDARLEAAPTETKLVREDVVAWLAEHDPTGELVASPGDVLALCADFDAHGASAATLQERARRWLEGSAVRAFGEQVPRAWAKRLAPRAFAALITNHLHDRRRAFGPRCGECWEELANGVEVPLSEKARPSGATVVAYLREADLLRGKDDGVAPFPAWVHRGLLLGALTRAFEEEESPPWGALAADSSRQAIVDDALDALSNISFLALVRSVLRASHEASLARTGAIEATFAAAARRLRVARLELNERIVAHLQGLALLQVELLVPPRDLPHEFHRPFTRRTMEDWLLNAWTLSVRVPRPDGFARDDLAWELPGWATLLPLRRLPPHGFPIGVSLGNASVGTPMAELAFAFISRIVGADAPKHLPNVLLPALMLCAEQGDWKLAPTHLEVFTDAWCARSLIDRASRLNVDQRANAAERLWHLIAEKLAKQGAPRTLAARIRDLVYRYPLLVPFVLENLREEDVATVVREDGLHRHWHTATSFDQTEPSFLRALPRALRQRAVREWLDRETPDKRWAEARELLSLFDPEDVDMLLELIRQADVHTVSEFAQPVWTFAPERAREAAYAAIATSDASAAGWCVVAPRGELAGLATQVEAQSSRPAWAQSWAQRFVLEAGEGAEAMFRLATSASASTELTARPAT